MRPESGALGLQTEIHTIFSCVLYFLVLEFTSTAHKAAGAKQIEASPPLFNNPETPMLLALPMRGVRPACTSEHGRCNVLGVRPSPAKGTAVRCYRHQEKQFRLVLVDLHDLQFFNRPADSSTTCGIAVVLHLRHCAGVEWNQQVAPSNGDANQASPHCRGPLQIHPR